MCAGNPALAANYAYYDACVDHSGEGIYAAVFMAAVQAAAFFESDVYLLIKTGLSYLPESCGVRNAVNLVINCYKNGDDWKTARKKLLIAEPSSFGEICGEWKGTPQVTACERCPVQEKDEDIPRAVHGHDAPASIGIVLIGWLYGGGDFGKSICLAVNCGEDADCTAGSLGAILGITHGASSLPEKWVKSCSEKIAVCSLRTDDMLNVPQTVSEFCKRVVKQFPVFSSSRCNFTENGFEIIKAENFEYAEHRDVFQIHKQEDFRELLAESPYTARFHFTGLTVKVKFDEMLVNINENQEKKLTVTFANGYFYPQFITLRVHGVPEEWKIKNGAEYAVGLEQWHSCKVNYTNSINILFTPVGLQKAKYEINFEISVNGRGERYFIPVTLLNGAC